MGGPVWAQSWRVWVWNQPTEPGPAPDIGRCSGRSGPAPRPSLRPPPTLPGIPASRHTASLHPTTPHPCFLPHCIPAPCHIASLHPATPHHCFPPHRNPATRHSASLHPAILYHFLLTISLLLATLSIPFLFPAPHLPGFLPMLGEYCGYFIGTHPSLEAGWIHNWDWRDLELFPAGPDPCAFEKESFLWNARLAASSPMVGGKPHK